MITSSFGRHDSDGGHVPPVPVPEPTPVLHVGEVHAELRLNITEDTLNELGSQIASMVARAVREGMIEGAAAAMADLDPPGPAPETSVSAPAGDRS